MNYLILDCETATLPIASTFEPEAKGQIALTKPLIYDLAWAIVDSDGNVTNKESFLISEIFSQPQIFETGYYAEKKPIYLKMLKNREIKMVSWFQAESALKQALEGIENVGAYNAMFDYKKAIAFTKAYIKNLYSSNFYIWEEKQAQSCLRIANKEPAKKSTPINKETFWLGRKPYKIFDIWAMACKTILNTDEYRKFCLDSGYHSKMYFKSSAEIAYRFLTQNHDFIESHTALSDVEIETEIFMKIIREYGEDFHKGIINFPFRLIGKVPK